ncbi:MAG TPA: hypothetical protein VMH03_11975 [Terriglobales bacterium]|nr:hypothetical protein [Terriglobales bacterium]
MAEEVIAIERRQYRREGVMKQLGDITYAVLRRYEIGGIKADSQGSSAS